MNDRLEICPKCGSDACYVTEVNEKINNYFCYGCGFQTNSLMKEGHPMLEDQLKIIPELYKDLKYEDEENKIWLPSTINIPDKGMIFCNGTSIKQWGWAAVKAVEVTEEEREKYPIHNKKDQYHKHRMDMNTLQLFVETNYLDAIFYLDLFPE